MGNEDHILTYSNLTKITFQGWEQGKWKGQMETIPYSPSLPNPGLSEGELTFMKHLIYANASQES